MEFLKIDDDGMAVYFGAIVTDSQLPTESSDNVTVCNPAEMFVIPPRPEGE